MHEGNSKSWMLIVRFIVTLTPIAFTILWWLITNLGATAITNQRKIAVLESQYVSISKDIDELKMGQDSGFRRMEILLGENRRGIERR